MAYHFALVCLIVSSIAVADFLKIEGGKKYQCGDWGCSRLFIAEDGEILFYRRGVLIPGDKNVVENILAEPDYVGEKINAYKERVRQFYKKNRFVPRSRFAKYPQAAMAASVHGGPTQATGRPEGEELIPPKNDYERFMHRLERINCNKRDYRILTTNILNPEDPNLHAYIHEGGWPNTAAYQRDTRAIAAESNRLLDYLDELKREGLVDATHVYDFRYYPEYRGGTRQKILFPSPNRNEIVILAGAGTTLASMRAFFESPEAQKRFAKNHRKRYEPRKPLLDCQNPSSMIP